MKTIKRWSARFQRKRIGPVTSPEPQREQQHPIGNILEGDFNPGIPVCRVCQSIRLYQHGRQGHHQSIAALRSSAESCPSCKLILTVVGSPKRFRHRSEPQGTLEFSYDSWSPNRGITIICENKILGHLDVFAEQGSSALASGGVVQLTPGRPDGLGRIPGWIEICKATHPNCAASALKLGNNTDDRAYLPTRVIDVGPSDGTLEPFLWETRGHHGEYLTLSHCWGQAKVLRTESSNLEELKGCIPFGALCQNFKDAITVTRRLGYRYLWIDSLCIIQDSIEDWDRESARMADIYLYSTLTLFASIAEDGNAGFLHRRTALDESCVKIPYVHITGAVDGHYILSRKLERRTKLTEQSTLNERGWVLQEAFLSRRSVLFGRDQLHWECQTSAWDEGETTFAPYEAEESNLLKLSKFIHDIPVIQRLNPDMDTPFDSWYNMIWEYCNRQLTFENDKLAAISGLANYFQRHSGYHYAAGLWEEDMARGLLWSKSSIADKMRRPSHPRAPTWSWASLDGPIKFLERDGIPQVVDIPQISDVKFDAEYSGSDRFGRISSASLTLTGRLQPVQLQKHEDDPELQTDYPEVMDEDGQVVGGAWLDDTKLVDNTCLYGFLVQIRSRKGQYDPESLLLQQTSQLSTFRRIGVFFLDTQPNVSSLDQPTDLSLPSFYKTARKEKIVLI